MPRVERIESRRVDDLEAPPTKTMGRRGRRKHANRRDLGAEQGVDEGALARVELADDREAKRPGALGGEVIEDGGGVAIVEGSRVRSEPSDDLGPRPRRVNGNPAPGDASRDGARPIDGARMADCEDGIEGLGAVRRGGSGEVSRVDELRVRPRRAEDAEAQGQRRSVAVLHRGVHERSSRGEVSGLDGLA